MTFDPAVLPILWSRLIAIVNEQATTLMRTSFTTVVREAGDLSAGIFDRRGRMVAQAVTGTPGHINTMARAVRHFLDRFPWSDLAPGDVLITNDPWLSAGHLNDLTVVTPIFQGKRPLALFASTCHSADIGGRTLGGEALDVFEEGLRIPITKLFTRGRRNAALWEMIGANVRLPALVFGDLESQVAGNFVAGRKLAAVLAEHRLRDLEALSDAITGRSERAMRRAIRGIPDGRYRHAIRIDGFDAPITIAVTVTVTGSRLAVDYAGSSPAAARGINVVLGYTHAYTTYPLMCALCPDVPNNDGTFRPVTVTAPPGSLLHAAPPAPVAARHIVGHFLCCAVFGALARAVPERVVADGACGLWATTVTGRDRRGDPFSYTFFANGGMGARPNRDGLSATSFPSGVRNVPVEVMESVSPVFVERKALRPDSGGGGRFRGGLGQEIVFEVRSQGPAVLSGIYERVRFPAQGMRGGAPRSPGPVHSLHRRGAPSQVQDPHPPRGPRPSQSARRRGLRLLPGPGPGPRPGGRAERDLGDRAGRAPAPEEKEDAGGRDVG